MCFTVMHKNDFTERRAKLASTFTAWKILTVAKWHGEQCYSLTSETKRYIWTPGAHKAKVSIINACYAAKGFYVYLTRPGRSSFSRKYGQTCVPFTVERRHVKAISRGYVFRGHTAALCSQVKLSERNFNTGLASIPEAAVISRNYADCPWKGLD